MVIALCFALVCVRLSRKAGQIKKVDSPGALYVQGIAHMKKKEWDKAIQAFGKVRENYPFDPIALVAQVKQADSNFEKKAYPSAAISYEDFVNSYPEDENAAYAPQTPCGLLRKDVSDPQTGTSQIRSRQSSDSPS